MTEAEWMKSADPVPMLEFLRDKASDQQWRLFEVAYLHYIRRIISPPSWRKAVEVAERNIERGKERIDQFSEVYRVLRRLPYNHAIDGDGAYQLVLLRDIFGNPFRPVSFDPAWHTSTVVAMPILADALRVAGCDNADILDHCRNEGSHVRGCWVVDLVLGKE
jgi:hypothetical protein